ncbi:unnamed protein product, partial [marine sediment metagenome]
KISIIINNNKYDGVFSSHFSSVPKDSLLILVGSTGYSIDFSVFKIFSSSALS